MIRNILSAIVLFLFKIWKNIVTKQNKVPKQTAELITMIRIKYIVTSTVFFETSQEFKLFIKLKYNNKETNTIIIGKLAILNLFFSVSISSKFLHIFYNMHIFIWLYFLIKLKISYNSLYYNILNNILKKNNVYIKV